MPKPDEDPMLIVQYLKESKFPLTLRYLSKVTGLNAHALSRILSQLITSGLVSQVTNADSLGFGVIQYRLDDSSEATYVDNSASNEEKPFLKKKIEDDATTAFSGFEKTRNRLSLEEEHRLIRKAQQGDDKKSESSLVVSYLSWLTGIAHSICNEPDKIPDLVQIGSETFLKCIRRFDKSRGNSLPGYAYRIVQGRMLAYLVRQDQLVRVPEVMRVIIRVVREATERLHLQHGREPLIQEIAEETELLEEVIRSANQANLAYSLNCVEPLPEDLRPANARFQPDQSVESKQLLEGLTRAVADSPNLTAREKKVLFLRYLVPVSERKKLRELAADMHISTSRIHRIERKAIKKLRKELDVEEYF